MEESDAQLQLKKRARRRLVGAVAFVLAVAVALPMVMDHEPKPAVQDVEIRIPGQDERPFAPKFASAPVQPTAPPAVEPPAAPQPAPSAPPAKAEAKAEPEPVPATRAADKATVAKPLEKPAAKPERPAEKPEKPAEKVDRVADKAEKPADKGAADRPPAAKDAEAKRAAAILAGKAAEPAPAKAGEQVILIGAFANEANVRTIRNKLGELGIKVYTEPLDSPQGRKTRVRAGPFVSREAADKALERMRRIGVSGVVVAKQ